MRYRRGVGVIVGGLGAWAVGCAPIGVSVKDDVSVRADDEMPVILGNEQIQVGVDGEVPVRMTERVPVQIDGETPVRMTAPVPVALVGPITLSISGPSVQYDGVYVSEELMKRIDADKTTAEWLLAVVGEPTGRATLSDGTEIWKWVYRPINHQAALIRIGDAEEPQPMPITAYVRLRNGVVIEKWRG